MSWMDYIVVGGVTLAAIIFLAMIFMPRKPKVEPIATAANEFAKHVTASKKLYVTKEQPRRERKSNVVKYNSVASPVVASTSTPTTSHTDDFLSPINPIGPFGPVIDAAGIWGTHRQASESAYSSPSVEHTPSTPSDYGSSSHSVHYGSQDTSSHSSYDSGSSSSDYGSSSYDSGSSCDSGSSSSSFD